MMLAELSVEPVSAAIVRAEKWVSRFVRPARFSSDDEEMERFCVLTANMSRFLSVIPANIAIKMQIRLAKVKPNGRATQTNLPAPILLIFFLSTIERRLFPSLERVCDNARLS